MVVLSSTAPILCRYACRSDNYGYLLHDPQSGETACIDTPDAKKALDEAETNGWKITQIWNTHWHDDHAGGNAEIKQATNCKIYGPEEVRSRLNAPVDQIVSDGVVLSLGDFAVNVLDTPGHTLQHVTYWLPEAEIAFVGDTLFSLGCGRMFEGDPEMFWNSLQKIKALPDNTQICCAHEYTLANLKYVESLNVNTPAFADFSAAIQAKRSRDEPTIPTLLKKEKQFNPFLRADEVSLQSALGTGRDAVETFAALRKGKDNF